MQNESATMERAVLRAAQRPHLGLSNEVSSQMATPVGSQVDMALKSSPGKTGLNRMECLGCPRDGSGRE
jgi:hypothetical protein